MIQWLRAPPAALPEDLSSISSTTQWFTSPWNSSSMVSIWLMPFLASVGIWTHPYTHARTHAHSTLKINKSAKKSVYKSKCDDDAQTCNPSTGEVKKRWVRNSQSSSAQRNYHQPERHGTLSQKQSVQKQKLLKITEMHTSIKQMT